MVFAKEFGSPIANMRSAPPVYPNDTVSEFVECMVEGVEVHILVSILNANSGTEPYNSKHCDCV